MIRPVSIEVSCSCGAAVSVTTHTLVNAEEQPHLMAQIEAGEFHNVVCKNCKKHIQVDKWFLFQDPKRNLLVHVFPREYRHSYLQLQEQLTPLHKLCGVETDGAVQLVFGIDGLLALLRGEVRQPPILFPEAIPNFHIRH